MKVLLAILAAILLPVLGGVGWLAVSEWRFVRYQRFKGLAPERLGVRHHLRELVAMATVALWHLRARFADALRVPAEARGLPVLCIHGFTQNGTNFWGLRLALEARGHPTRAVSMGLPFRRIERHAERVVEALEEMAEQFPQGFQVVAHSMGGIVLRHVLALHPRLAPPVRRVVTVGTPHAGTAGARGFVGWECDARQLGRRSGFLEDLPALTEVAPAADLVTVGSARDLVTYPVQSSLPPGTRPIRLDDLGHAGLLTHPTAIARIADELAAPTAAETTRPGAVGGPGRA